jgi:hypothetical protein
MRVMKKETRVFTGYLVSLQAFVLLIWGALPWDQVLSLVF